ncbi:hypothetical protein BDV3_002124 [Batrachochytrium dendrobatidis]|nr:hypothetical protein BDEG_27003 [Batrachochytrium dendrobatidis JEL423]
MQLGNAWPNDILQKAGLLWTSALHDSIDSFTNIYKNIFLIQSSDISSTSVAIGLLALVVFVTYKIAVFYKISLKYTTDLVQQISHVCFYCGTVKQWRVQSNSGLENIIINSNGQTVQWLCKACDSVNRYDENGDIAGPENPFMEHSSHSDFTANKIKGSAFSQNVFCDNCIHNQQLVADILRDYDPPEGDGWEESYKSYKTSLESRYPIVCSLCAPHVRNCLRNTSQFNPFSSDSRQPNDVQNSTCVPLCSNSSYRLQKATRLLTGIVALCILGIMIRYETGSVTFTNVKLLSESLIAVDLSLLVKVIFVWVASGLSCMSVKNASTILIQPKHHPISYSFLWVLPATSVISGAYLVRMNYLDSIDTVLDSSSTPIDIHALTILNITVLISIVRLILVIVPFNQIWRYAISQRAIGELQNSAYYAKLQRPSPLKSQSSLRQSAFESSNKASTSNIFASQTNLSASTIKPLNFNIEEASELLSSSNALDALSFEDGTSWRQQRSTNSHTENTATMDWEGPLGSTTKKSSSNLFSVQSPQFPVPWHMQVRGPRILPPKTKLPFSASFSDSMHRPAFGMTGSSGHSARHFPTREGSFSSNSGFPISHDRQFLNRKKPFGALALSNGISNSTTDSYNRKNSQYDDSISGITNLFASKATLKTSKPTSNAVDVAHIRIGTAAIFICGVLSTLLIVMVVFQMR